MFQRIEDWFTAARRRAVYAAVAALAPALVAFGVLAPAQVEPVLVLATVALQALAGVLQLRHLSVADAADWFRRSGRQTIYTAALAVAPAAAAFGWISDTAPVLEALSLGLTVLASVVAVAHLEPGDQADVPAPF
jgi:hypothetical protein